MMVRTFVYYLFYFCLCVSCEDCIGDINVFFLSEETASRCLEKPPMFTHPAATVVWWAHVLLTCRRHASTSSRLQHIIRTSSGLTVNTALPSRLRRTNTRTHRRIQLPKQHDLTQHSSERQEAQYE